MLNLKSVKQKKMITIVLIRMKKITIILKILIKNTNYIINTVKKALKKHNSRNNSQRCFHLKKKIAMM